MDSCSICCEDITTARVITSCNHMFHMKCLTQWYSKNSDQTCPLCRKKAENLERLHMTTEFTLTNKVTLTNDMIPPTITEILGQVSFIDAIREYYNNIQNH
jgi:hypothetical protein